MLLAAKCMFALLLVVVLLDIQPTYAKGGRGGGGSRGGGSRGSSSGSRGSSSSSSGSRGSSSSGSSGSHGSSSSSSSTNRGQIDYSSSSGNNRPSQPKPSVDLTPQAVKPSAPELPRANPPSAGLPQSPGNSQPSNPYPYNPNSGQPGRPGPDISRGNQPPVHGTNQGNPNPPPYSPRENPPPYGVNTGGGMPHAPPPYGSHPGNIPQGGQPPYGGVYNPNMPQGNPPPYGVNTGGGIPHAPPPYGSYPGNIPQGGQPPYGSVNRPNMPQGNPPPYGVNPGLGSQGYPGSHGVQPPYNSPYPRQPGMGYPPAGAGSSNFFVPGGSYQGSSSIQPHKKKGLLGGILSLGKSSHNKPKHHGIGSFGTSSLGGNKISPVHMLLPVMAARRAHMPFSHSNHMSWMLPYAIMHQHRGYGGFGYDGDHYRGRCFRPRAPDKGSVECEMNLNGILCKARCLEGYAFSDNSTMLEAQCWQYSGHWSRSKYFPPCKAYCNETCLNGGTCKVPGMCRCKPEYRGNHCEHHITECDVRSIAVGSKVTWVCSHARNETLCTIRCRPPLEFESPPAEQYHCHINGTWTPDRIPPCI